MKNLELPDLFQMVCFAVPHQEKDCWIIRGQKENSRKRLTAQIKEYAELYHLKRLSEETH